MAALRTLHNPLFLLSLDSNEADPLGNPPVYFEHPGRPEPASESHRLIIDRIRVGDPEGAERAMNEHLGESLLAWRILPFDINEQSPAAPQHSAAIVEQSAAAVEPAGT